jgi:hypothetical protein
MSICSIKYYPCILNGEISLVVDSVYMDNTLYLIHIANLMLDILKVFEKGISRTINLHI